MKDRDKLNLPGHELRNGREDSASYKCPFGPDWDTSVVRPKVENNPPHTRRTDTRLSVDVHEPTTAPMGSGPSQTPSCFP